MLSRLRPAASCTAPACKALAQVLVGDGEVLAQIMLGRRCMPP